MTGPLIQLGVTTDQIQAFVLTYASAWVQVPGRIQAVIDKATQTGNADTLNAAEQTQLAYAQVSGDVGQLIASYNQGQPLDIGMAVQTIPSAIGILGSVDRLEQSVGMQPGVKVTARVPWFTYLLLAVPAYFLLRKKKGRR